jgi:hypothetical protein
MRRIYNVFNRFTKCLTISQVCRATNELKGFYNPIIPKTVAIADCVCGQLNAAKRVSLINLKALRLAALI